MGQGSQQHREQDAEGLIYAWTWVCRSVSPRISSTTIDFATGRGSNDRAKPHKIHSTGYSSCDDSEKAHPEFWARANVSRNKSGSSDDRPDIVVRLKCGKRVAAAIEGTQYIGSRQ